MKLSNLLLILLNLKNSLDASDNLNKTDESNQDEIEKHVATLMISTCSYIQEADRLLKYMNGHQSIVASSKEYTELRNHLNTPYQNQIAQTDEDVPTKEKICKDAEYWLEHAE